MKNKNPLVSVIIPNYCHADYLEQRITSVLNQTYNNIEVIILDDCSPDNGASRSIIEKYRKDPKVSHIVYCEKNSGSTFLQWQKGLSLANGDLCWIAESDDFCEPELLKELITAYNKGKDIVIAYSPVVYTDKRGCVTGYYSRVGRTQFVKSKDFIVKYLTPDNCIQNASCAIFLREAALSINPDYSQHGGISDWWFWFEIAELGNVAIVNKHLSYFRRHDNTVTLNSIKDGSNLVHEKYLLEFIKERYNLPQWRMSYLYHCHAESKRNLPFNSKEVYDQMSILWNFDRKYTRLECWLFRILSKLKNNYLIRL